MILIWGVSEDGPTAAVIAALERSGNRFCLIDQHQVLNAGLDLWVNQGVHGRIRFNCQEIDLDQVVGLYLRPHDSSRLAGIGATSPASSAHAAQFENAMLCWSELTSARVINRPSAMASNHSKPYQIALIHAQGFAVPQTLLTTDAARLEAFWEKHGQVIYKSTSGVRSIVSRLVPEHRKRFSDLRSCPTQFQQWIPGTDVRVHVVGKEIFACKIGSSAIDYRYPQNEDECPVISPFRLTEELAARSRRLVESLGLVVAGIDLRCTPEGDWYCFEVNPSPGFTYYEQATGQPLADAFARELMAPESSLRE